MLLAWRLCIGPVSVAVSFTRGVDVALLQSVYARFGKIASAPDRNGAAKLFSLFVPMRLDNCLVADSHACTVVREAVAMTEHNESRIA